MSGRVDLPEPLLQLLRGSAHCDLATLQADGAPKLTQVWVDTDGTDILINTVDGFAKVRNVRRDPRVALTVADPERPVRYFQVRGIVTAITDEGGAEHIEALAQRYLGGPYPWWGGRDQVRLIMTVRPDRIVAPAI